MNRLVSTPSSAPTSKNEVTGLKKRKKAFESEHSYDQLSGENKCILYTIGPNTPI